MRTFVKDETVVIRGTVKDEDGVLITIPPGPKVTVLDPLGVAVVDAQTAPPIGEGVFRYLYNPSSPALGVYHVRATVQDVAHPASMNSISDSEFFLVD